MPHIPKPSPRLLALIITLAFLAIYTRTAAPGLLSGDSAEFQLASVTMGVPHPTTYPLYTLLGQLAFRLIPFGEPAWRITMVSVISTALAVGLFCLLVIRLGASRRAALLGAGLLGVTPGLWNAATLAEVYALLALLIVVAGVAAPSNQEPRTKEPKNKGTNLQSLVFNSPLSALLLSRLGVSNAPHDRHNQPLSTFFMGLIVGLGFTHHGLFAITILPMWIVWVAWKTWKTWENLLSEPAAAIRFSRKQIRIPLLSLVGFAIGCLPWLYPLIQYARLGPFSGEDYGLPKHYYWSAPTNWSAVFDLLTGGTVRRGIFRMPTLEQALATFTMLRERALFEFGWFGLIFTMIGCFLIWRHLYTAWLACIWIIIATSAYLFLLGPAVADAPIFTLPMLIPIAIWATFGIDGVLRVVEGKRLPIHPALSLIITLFLIGWLVWWADTRVEYASKRNLTLYRTFGEAVLQELPPNTVVLAHWEQGMVLQYLHTAEGQRPDIWVDVVEPSDEAWQPRITRRYANREVFLIGQALDVEGIPVELVHEDSYGLLFRVRR